MADAKDTKPRNGLSLLLDTLREEIEGWELAPTDTPQTPEEIRSIRYGAYMMALDVLYCESLNPGDGYAFYESYPVSVKLPREDYAAFRVQLAPYIQWLGTLNLNLARIDDDGASITVEENVDGQTTLVTITDQPLFSDWLRTLRSAT